MRENTLALGRSEREEQEIRGNSSFILWRSFSDIYKYLVLFAGLFIATSGAFAQVVVHSTTQSSGSGSSLTFSHTVPNVSNRLLLVGISVYSGGDGNGVSSVTFNGTSMSLVESLAPAGSANIRVYIWIT